MPEHKDFDKTLHLVCDRCGRHEEFPAVIGLDNEPYTDADADAGMLAWWNAEGWSHGFGEAICPGCVTEADMREDDGACLRCGKEQIEDLGEAFIAEDRFNPDPNADILVCGDCYTDEDRAWGQAQLRRIEDEGRQRKGES